MTSKTLNIKSYFTRIFDWFKSLSLQSNNYIEDRTYHPFWVMIRKEISDLVRSWRFIILFSIIVLTCFSSIYTSLSQFSEAVKSFKEDEAFFFLKLFTLSDGTLPSFAMFISFLGPLLGISLGFDAINSEQNKGTLSRIISQPIYRDYVINAKFLSALIVISLLFVALTLLVLGAGLIAIGIPPTPDEIMRLFFFTLINIVYVAFWLNLSIFFSVKFKQPATSALSGIAIWLFFSIFYNMLVNFFAQAIAPKGMFLKSQIAAFSNFILNFRRFNPCYLFSEATTILLMPNERSLGTLTMEQMEGIIPAPLPLGESLLVIWPQVTILIAGSILLFALGYYSFMRREIRSR